MTRNDFHVPHLFFAIVVALILLFTTSFVFAARVPVVGGDTNNWGTILNEFLQLQHTSSGTHGNVTADSLNVSGDLVSGSTEIRDKGIYLASSFAFANYRLFISTSPDGLIWTPARGSYLYVAATGLRDPSIVHYAGRFWIAYTAANGPADTETAFGIAQSLDLVNWNLVTSPNPGVSGENRVWAPEWFVDSDGSIHILMAVSADGGTTFGIYELHPTNSDLTAWSNGTLLTWSSGTPSDPIDPFVVKIGSTYHLFYSHGSSTQYVEYSTASALTGPYTVVGSGNWAGWSSGLEGESLVQVNASTWRIYLDAGTGTMYYSESTNNFSSWSAKTTVNQFFGMQHPTIIRSFSFDVLKKAVLASALPPQTIFMNTNTLGVSFSPGLVTDRAGSGKDFYITRQATGGTDYIKFIGGGINVSFFGSVGIGTTSPTHALTVVGTVNVTGSVFVGTSSFVCNSANEGRIFFNTSSKQFLGCNGTAFVTL